MREASEDDVFEFFRLFIDGLSDLRMGMAMQIHPPAADGIEISIPVIVIQPGTFGMGDNDVFLFILLVGEGMPDEGAVYLGEIHNSCGRWKLEGGS